MSKIALEGNSLGSGTFTIAAPNSNSNPTLTLPTSSGTVVVTGGAQTIEFAAGTAAAPSITFTGDTNTGIFSPGADTIAFAEGGAEAMRIDSSGNVGIGATSITPRDSGARVLELYGGTSGRASIKMNNSTSGTGATDGLFMGYDDNLNFNILNSEAGIISFGTSNTERMRIDSSGNVGIGTSSPLSASNYVFVTVQGGSSGGGYIQYNSSGSRIGQFTQDSTTAYLGNFSNNPLVFQTNNTERARITSDGEVCINTTGIGSTKLRVYQNGNSNDNSYSGIDIIKGSNNTTTAQVFQRFFTDAGNVGNGSITANGVSGATFTAYSDRRLKENIQDLPPQLDNICRLKPSEFDYIGYPEGQGHQIGFIAQDMQEVYPDVVAADGEGMLQIGGWSKTEARLVKAIQELKAITDAQATRIEALEAEVAALKGQ